MFGKKTAALDRDVEKLLRRIERLEAQFISAEEFVTCAVCGVLLRKSFAKEVDEVKKGDRLSPYGFTTRKYIDTKYFCKEHSREKEDDTKNVDDNE